MALLCKDCKQSLAIGHSCKPFIMGVSNISHINDYQQNMPQEMRSPDFGDFQKQTVMSTQTEFDEAFDEIMLKDMQYTGWNGHVEAEVYQKAKQAIKQAVDKYVIGESETLSNKQVKAGRIYILGDPQGDAQDRLRDKQRLALWGDI